MQILHTLLQLYTVLFFVFFFHLRNTVFISFMRSRIKPKYILTHTPIHLNRTQHLYISLQYIPCNEEQSLWLMDKNETKKKWEKK